MNIKCCYDVMQIISKEKLTCFREMNIKSSHRKLFIERANTFKVEYVIRVLDCNRKIVDACCSLKRLNFFNNKIAALTHSNGRL